jgi:hypothetical protein
MRVLIFAFVVAAASGCARKAHLTKQFGSSYDAAFATQSPNAAGKTPVAEATTGLDSQEAAIISDSYRTSLAPKGVDVGEPPVLVLSPSRGEARSAMPPPSVPKE